MARMPDIKSLTRRIIQFRDARDWKQFHNPKDVSLSLVLETGEVMEHFQWKTNEETKEEVKKKAKRDEIGEELADVFYWTILIAHDLNIDLEKAFKKKMKKNAKKCPVRKSRNSHAKYTAYTK